MLLETRNKRFNPKGRIKANMLDMLVTLTKKKTENRCRAVCSA